jgi:hypothetical protein
MSPSAIGEIAVPLLYERLPTLRTDPRRSEAWFGTRAPSPSAQTS